MRVRLVRVFDCENQESLITLLGYVKEVQLAQIVSCVGPLLGACPSLIPHTRDYLCYHIHYHYPHRTRQRRGKP